MNDESHDSERGGIATEIGELHRLLVESVRDYAIFALDQQGYILSWNPGAERFNGYTAEEAIGKHFSIFYPQEKIDEKFPDFELREAARVGRFEDEGWRVRKDGTRFWASVIITALRDDQGTLLGFAKVTRDLTERRAAQERAIADARRLAAEEEARRTAEERARELRALAAQLQAQATELEVRSREAEEANRAKSQFLAAMSHELRTPLNAIGGYAELMELGVSGPVTRQQRDQLDRIRRSQQHLLGIINDILNFSRLEAGRLRYDLAPVPVNDVIVAVCDMVTPQATSKGLRVEQRICAGTPMMQADRPKLEQILVNLLSNAVKFTEAGGMIAVSCREVGDGLAIDVRDTGVGIPADKLQAVFEPFVQVGRALNTAHEGTGLGLAISRDLARAMGGDVTVTSNPDAGSTFTVTLPRATSTP